MTLLLSDAADCELTIANRKCVCDAIVELVNTVDLQSTESGFKPQWRHQRDVSSHVTPFASSWSGLSKPRIFEVGQVAHLVS